MSKIMLDKTRLKKYPDFAMYEKDKHSNINQGRQVSGSHIFFDVHSNRGFDGLFLLLNEGDDMGGSYSDFLEKKSQLGGNYGFEPIFIPDYLFDFQKALIEWNMVKGGGLLAEDCGLGKTVQELVIAENVVRKTNGNVLILAPLAVSYQFITEGEKFWIEVKRSIDGKPAGKITVTNYEKLHLFNPEDYVMVVCDECFPPDIPIDVLNLDKSLTTMYIKDVDENTLIYNAQGEDNVQGKHKRRINRAVYIGINGRYFTCSENHPFFTLHGWRSAQDLQPGDYVMETAEAVRLVRGDIQSKVFSYENAAVLRDILLIEMENERPRTQGKSTQSESKRKNRQFGVEMVEVISPHGGSTNETDYRTLSNERSESEGKSIAYITEYEPQAFRAWGKWTRDDIASANNEGCFVGELDCGIQYITGKASTRFSQSLQAGLRESRLKNRDRSRREQSLQQKKTRRKEGQKAGFIRVESVEILEQGHPELEKYRDADGNIYFYDIKAKRHPSYSINGMLVHNSSRLKHFGGATQKNVNRFLLKIKYRTLATATAAPNDFYELGTSAEALGVLGHSEMLTRFFNQSDNKSYRMNEIKLLRAAKNPGKHYGKLAYRAAQQIGQWKLKPHAEIPFWKWVCSWAKACRMPSDLGFDDGDFILPKLKQVDHIVIPEKPPEGMLFNLEVFGLNAEREERKRSMEERCGLVADLANKKDPVFIGVHFNYEADLIEKLIPGSVQVSGSHSDEEKEERLLGFAKGDFRVLITKPKIGAWGLNYQHCNHVITFASHSYEQFYQLIRRCYRFGQKRPVTVDVISTEGEQSVRDNMKRKSDAADQMFTNLCKYMNESTWIDRDKYEMKVTVPKWVKGGI